MIFWAFGSEEKDMKKMLVLFLLATMLPMSLFACGFLEGDTESKSESNSESSSEGENSDKAEQSNVTVMGDGSADDSVKAKRFSAVVLGDSIARGYGLESVETMRFSALLENSLKSIYNEVDIANYGVDGRTGEQLLEWLKTDAPEEMKSCDCVIISIGGNNILQMLDSAETAMNALMELDPKAVADYFKYTLSEEGEEKDKLAYACEILSDVFGAVNAAFESETFNNLIVDAGDRLYNDIPLIIAEIRKINPDAKIYFQTVYNPYKDINISLQDVEEKLDLNTYGERAVAKLNAPIEALAEECGYEVVPVWSEFDKSNKTLTNAGISLFNASISVDPHPNARGHELIAEIYFRIISEAKNG